MTESASKGTGRVRSLAATDVGQPVTVLQILFDSLRQHCAELGVAQGDRVAWDGPAAGVGAGQGAGHGAKVLRLEKAGRVVPCDDRLARFVEVEVPAATVAGAGAVGGSAVMGKVDGKVVPGGRQGEPAVGA